MKKGMLGVVTTAVVVLTWGSVAFGGRPLETTGAEPTDKGAVELEVGLEYSSGAVVSRCFDLDVSLTVGIIENVEIAVSAGGTAYSEAFGTKTSGQRDASLSAKWRFAGNEQSPVSAAAVGSVSFPTGSESKGLGSGCVDGSGGIALSWPLPGQLTGHVNAVYSACQHDNDTVTLAAAIERPVGEKVTLVAECATDQSTAGNKQDESSRALVGIVMNASEKAAVDLGFRFGLDGRTPDIAVIAGVTYAF